MKLIMVLVVFLIACAGKNGSNGSNGLQGLPGTSGLTGPSGSQGNTGLTGPRGADGQIATVVQLCPGVTTYPGVFVEVALCINNQLYGVYSANNGFLTLLVPGSYTSNAIGSACNLTILDNCIVTN